MKVVHLATYDRGGGGFEAAFRLHRNMRLAGIDSRMMVLKKVSDDPDVIEVKSQLRWFDRLRLLRNAIMRKLARRKFRPSRFFSVDSQKMFPVGRLVDMLPFQPDVIIAHWIANFVTPGMLRDLNRMSGAPILWYLMDMAPLTGGCHYTFGCVEFIKQCGNCPQLGCGRGSRDLSNDQWTNKWSCLQKTNITAVAATSWLMKQIELSSIFRNKRHETILLAVNPDVFCRGSQKEARIQLNLPTDRKIIFFGSHLLHEERKGFKYLVGALRLMYVALCQNTILRDKILIVTAGMVGEQPNLGLTFDHQHIGFLKGDVLLSSAYRAADVFVNASIEDAGPMMINESLLCGTPVVSFEMGVAADLVHTDRTGYRALLKDEQDLAAGLRRILELDDEASEAMRERCRNYGLLKCHPNVQIREFEALCNELCECK